MAILRKHLILDLALIGLVVLAFAVFTATGTAHGAGPEYKPAEATASASDYYGSAHESGAALRRYRLRQLIRILHRNDRLNCHPNVHPGCAPHDHGPNCHPNLHPGCRTNDWPNR